MNRARTEDFEAATFADSLTDFWKSGTSQNPRANKPRRFHMGLPSGSSLLSVNVKEPLSAR